MKIVTKEEFDNLPLGSIFQCYDALGECFGLSMLRAAVSPTPTGLHWVQTIVDTCQLENDNPEEPISETIYKETSDEENTYIVWELEDIDNLIESLQFAKEVING